MRIAILGAGRLGKSLGTALRASSHNVVYGERQPRASGDVMTKTVGGAIDGADAVILAIPWTAAEALVCEHAAALNDKIVIDATNPLNTSATRLALGFDTSGVELLQSHVHGATFFKTFNMAGVGAIAKPSYPQGRAAMFVAGPKGPKKDIVLRLVADVGFDPWMPATSAPRGCSSHWECCGFNSRKPRGEAAISPSCSPPASGDSLDPYAPATWWRRRRRRPADEELRLPLRSGNEGLRDPGDART